MVRPQSIHDAVAAAVRDVGLCDEPSHMIRTILLRDRYFVGHKYRFDGGYAIWIAATDAIEVYSDDGSLLKTVALRPSEDAA
jgi:hypothetical protein